MVNPAISPPPVREQGAGKVFGDMHQFVNEDPGLVVIMQMVKFLAQHFKGIMGFNPQGFLPNGGETPDSGAGTRA